ncbi:hypothetical protein DFH07DRAFT_901341 [Mycena maculata]|uniref:Senescence domain-containing protein n=1 Tax=Mycena maculata TaxID=230809 RepID=A0AAD7K9Z8_9AGAR|nr:hypothetical protein DFH07DRAFT_901341 [Mycena maculata]
MSAYDADAFLLLNLSNCSLNTVHQSGSLALQCVTIQVPGAPAVYLVLRLNETEFPIEPTRVIRTNFSESGLRTYTFLPTEADPVELVLTVALPKFPDSHFLEDIEVFESILTQYADLQGFLAPQDVLDDNPNIYDKTDLKELRGHLVFVNEDNGEVIGEFDKKFAVQEDPQLGTKGREGDPVFIEINEFLTDEDHDTSAMQIFARAIPPENQDWITKSATVISHAISGGTTLLLTAISAGSSYYTSHSKPSPGHAASSSSGPPPLPPRAVAFLSSARTRKGLTAIHSVSGEAVKVSAKTVELIDGLIKSAVGSSKGKAKASSTLSPNPKPPLPPRAPTPSSSYLAPPPPYTPSASAPPSSEKPPLPARRQPSPSPSSSRKPPLPPRTESGMPIGAVPPVPKEKFVVKLSTTTRIFLSADLILSTIDNSTRRLLDSGTDNIGTVVGHKYGAEAGESSVLLAGTARNVGLVYIDMRGIGRRALLRRVGKEFVKGRVSDMAQKKA